MDIDFELKRSKKLAVPSQSAAEHRLRGWLAENDYHQMADCLGQLWSLDLVFDESLDKLGKNMTYKLKIVLQCRRSASELVAAGVLDETQDSRLIRLIGVDKIPFRVVWKTFGSPSMGEVRETLTETIVQIRRYLKDAEQLKTQQRTIVGQYINKKMSFGALI